MMPSGPHRGMLFGCLLVAMLVIAWWWNSPPRPSLPVDGPASRRSLPAVLFSEPPLEFARITTPRPLAFPSDHGPHRDVQIEWWYLTGNLFDREQRRYGFELTFFRVGLLPGPIPRPSNWAATELYVAHFALADVDRRTFHSSERISRAALGLAGATAEPFRVWVDDWFIAGRDPDLSQLAVRAREENTSVDLELTAMKPLVLHGDRGYSAKGSGVGNASYYYSLTRLAVSGIVDIDGEPTAVSGRAWFDHEWSTTLLEPNTVGWDWFALQLDDGTDVMVYELRQREGTPNAWSRGTIVPDRGPARQLWGGAFRLEVNKHWTSPHTAARYPASWRLQIPSESLDLSVVPVLPDQELRLQVRYWEGAVDVVGTRRGRPIEGTGYVELVGYPGDDTPDPRHRK